MVPSLSKWRGKHHADFAKGRQALLRSLAMLRDRQDLQQHRRVRGPPRWDSSCNRPGRPTLTHQGRFAAPGQLLQQELHAKRRPHGRYLEEVRKLEKHFKGIELMHIPRKENSEADEITKRASRRQPQEAGVFEERLSKASIKQPQEVSPPSTYEQLPPPPAIGAPDCGPPSWARLMMTMVHQETCWVDELKDYLLKGTLPEEDAEAERVARPAKSYFILEGDLYRKRPNGIALKCVPPRKDECSLKTYTAVNVASTPLREPSLARSLGAASTGPKCFKTLPLLPKHAMHASSMRSKYINQLWASTPSRPHGPSRSGDWTS